MAEPRSLDEYVALFEANMAMSGFGIEHTTMHMPCAFCAAPDFMVYRIIDAEEAMKQTWTCASCGRSGTHLFTYGPGDSKSFEFVQTGGPDAPEWLRPAPRRIEEQAGPS